MIRKKHARTQERRIKEEAKKITGDYKKVVFPLQTS